MVGHFVMLHGITGSADKMRPLAEKFCPSGWDVLVLDAPFPHPRGGFAWWIRDAPATEYLDNETLSQLQISVDFVVGNLPTDGPIIVGGFSQGGAVAQELLLTEAAERIVGVVVLASTAARPLILLEKLCELPSQRLFSMHGERDAIVPMKQADEYTRLYEEAGWDVTKVRHQKGHMVDLGSEDTLHDWLRKTVQ
ncbi:MAG TPA: alpha/beta fold hydrolase [Candidatus Poseidoniales archaeon]|nr:alpha/beta fold hydrolase [Candidatus Poseidoniales archaeon]HIO25170.1 alpha/beta fold hydrolase [Candidatus Poseidoniales archaeon]